MSTELPRILYACHMGQQGPEEAVCGQRSHPAEYPVSLWLQDLLLHPYSTLGVPEMLWEGGSLRPSLHPSHFHVILCFADFMENRYSVSTHFINIFLNSPLNSVIFPDSPRFCIPTNYTPTPASSVLDQEPLATQN